MKKVEIKAGKKEKNRENEKRGGKRKRLPVEKRHSNDKRGEKGKRLPVSQSSSRNAVTRSHQNLLAP